jgi:hypothetical protein
MWAGAGRLIAGRWVPERAGITVLALAHDAATCARRSGRTQAQTLKNRWKRQPPSAVVNLRE